MGRLAAALLLLLAPVDALASPQRVVSLGLCTDELLLLLADHRQIASVSFLGKDLHETPLASRARGVPENSGKLAGVIALDPDLVVTGGAVNRFAAELGKRLGIAILDLPPPVSFAGLEANIRKLAAALGKPDRGAALIRAMRRYLGRAPRSARAAMFVQPGGLTAPQSGIAAELLTYAGIRLNAAPKLRLDREQLLVNPPELIITSNYRGSEYSVAQSWFLPSGPWRHLRVDGRLWTCPSPLAVKDVARLRKEIAP